MSLFTRYVSLTGTSGYVQHHHRLKVILKLSLTPSARLDHGSFGSAAVRVSEAQLGSLGYTFILVAMSSESFRQDSSERSTLR